MFSHSQVGEDTAEPPTPSGRPALSFSAPPDPAGLAPLRAQAGVVPVPPDSQLPFSQREHSRDRVRVRYQANSVADVGEDSGSLRPVTRGRTRLLIIWSDRVIKKPRWKLLF